MFIYSFICRLCTYFLVIQIPSYWFHILHNLSLSLTGTNNLLSCTELDNKIQVISTDTQSLGYIVNIEQL